MNSSETAFDRAEELAEGERETGIKAASKALQRPGTRTCMNCGEEIDRIRKATLPSARRCLKCQQAFEATQESR